jgi:hypothetical protein
VRKGSKRPAEVRGARHARSGAAIGGTAFLVMMVLIALAAGYWVLTARGPLLPSPVAPAADTKAIEAKTPTAANDLAPSPVNAARATTPAPSAGTTTFTAEHYSGAGRVRGEIHAGEGVTFPKNWTLVFEPHPFLEGSEYAEKRRVEFQNGETSFDVSGLSRGGYRVRAESPGLNGSEEGVLLVKGSSDVFVTLEFRRAGLIDGRVFDAHDAPAEGLEVVLESRSTQVRVSTRVDASGLYVFRDVIDGGYTIYFGSPSSPALPAAEVVFQAPSLRFHDQKLGPTGGLLVRTLDERGVAIGEVDVTGFGNPRGSIDARAGYDGTLRLRWLVPGQYKLEAKSSDGRRGKMTIDVGEGPDTQAAIVLKS